ncbi:hypothetical protein AJ79_04478 [Helicocarpus griseus UAMH5409]|uniref:Calcineurin-like phosphoesterase domain-containing protein n=1 Tax=Helicocarpus griseus UAMH5409 TaxID=1447875 RepID=A0A2B7XSZ0_9EURO|nr:hypothetical protein AJ79_04478 [Helicocarpus griseus UAMH5409]
MDSTSTTSTSNIVTRFLVISETHGMEFTQETKPLEYADVAIHCGDLTEGSNLKEFQSAIKLLAELPGPLKLVIAGNHDFTLDIQREYGDYGEIKQLFDEAASMGILLLDEGVHDISLKNGASLAVFASPFTPSFGDSRFQYSNNEGHHFAIDTGVDLVMTHGPPKGIMDYTADRQRAGCPRLFETIARTRPRVHCFGHIHEGWGAKVVTWRDDISENPSHFADIDNERSYVVEKLSTLSGSTFDTADIVEEKWKKLKNYSNQRYYKTSQCVSDDNPLEPGAQTLFVNAAIQGIEQEYPLHLPWLIDIELPKANQVKRQS